MELNTAASVISYISKIEQESAEFYEKWSKPHEALKEAFSSFAKENTKSEKNIKRAYYNVVSDALETGFCFKGLIGDVIIPVLHNDASVSEILGASLDLEKIIQAFYFRAAGLSKALLSDVARALERAAKFRTTRVDKLRSMLEP